MSKTVDERIVSMQFDNSQFEKNVSTSMSTIDKLKQKLNFSGSTKGLENISSAAKKVDVSGIGKGVEAVQVKFTSLQVAAATALANITNSAVNAGKNIAAALTIDPIKDGFTEYETQINSVQTILANTQKEGTNIQQVNAALDELNTYADKTIYNFTEMTRNIGTFTAAGVKLQTSVKSIQGIANLAAISGSTSAQASTAMYQLSQAIAAGTVKLMDWNSVVNAGMGGQVFQDALIRTSEHLKTGANEAIKAKGSFRESLAEGWLTSEVLTTTLEQFALTVDTAEDYNNAIKSLVSQGYTQEEAKAIADMAKTAGDAATKVKTFTQLIDTLKEALGSGWTQTWRLIIGDFEEAKELWTSVSDFFSNIINESANRRNALIEGAMGSPFGQLAEKIEKVTGATKEMTEVTQKYGELVDKIINGDFGNGQARIEALTKAGFDWAHAQNLVNEKLGDGTKHATDFKESQEGLNESQSTTIEQLMKMSDAQLKNLGFTKDEIQAFRELEEQSKKTGINIKDLLKDMSQLNGRTLLINSFKNIGTSLVKIFSSIGAAYREIFTPMTSRQLYDIIAGFHKLTTNLIISDENADKLKRTFKGLFAALDIIKTLLGGGISLGFKVLSMALQSLNMNILDVTATMGDAVVAFRDFLTTNEVVTKGVELLVTIIAKVTGAIASLVKSFMSLPQVQKALDSIKKGLSDFYNLITKTSFVDDNLSRMVSVLQRLGSAVLDLLDKISKLPQVQRAFNSLQNGVSKFVEIGANVIQGLLGGLENGMSSVPEMLADLGRRMIESICNVLGIHSPSTEMYDVGDNAIQGLFNGIRDGFTSVLDLISDLGTAMVDRIKSFDWPTIFAGGVSVVLLYLVKNFTETMDAITAPMAGVGDLLSGAGEVLDKAAKPIAKVLKNVASVVKGFSKVLNAYAFSINAKALRNIAISIGILAASVYVLAQLDTGDLWKSIAAVGALAGILVALAFAVDKMSGVSGSFADGKLNFSGVNKSLLGIGVTLILVSQAVKIMGQMDPNQARQGFIALAGMIGAILLVVAAYGKLVNGKAAKNTDKFATMLVKIGTAMLMMVKVVSLAGKLSKEALIKGAGFAAGFVIFIGALSAITSEAGRSKQISALGNLVLKVAIAMGLMVGVVKLVNLLSPSEMLKGAAFAAAFVIFIAALVKVTKVGKKDQVAKVGGIVLAVASSMLLMALVIKMVSGMSVGALVKGGAVVAAFALIIKGLIKVVASAGPQAPKLAVTLLAMAGAIAILAGVAIVLSLISISGLAKGIIAVGMLATVMSLMIRATKGASDCKANLVAMTVAIAVMAAAVVALSFIKPEKLAGATAALSILMGMFAIMAKASSAIRSSLASIGIMVGVVAALAAILYLLSSLPIESSLSTAASLSMMLLSMSAAMAIISKIGTVAPTALVAIGVMTLVMAALAAILAVMSKLDVGPTLEIALSLSTMLLAMSAACAILATVGMLGPAALTGIASMMAMIVGVGGLITAIGALTTYFPQLEQFLNKGITILEQIGTGLGSFFGNIVGGFLGSVSAGLPDVGTNLSSFMTNLQPFINGANSIDEGAAAGAKSLAEMILILSAAEIVNGIASWLTGGSSMTDFAVQLLPFGVSMVAFSQVVSGNINEEAVTAAANCGKMLAEMAATIPNSGGLIAFFAGENDLVTFGAQLPLFGTALVGFSQVVSGNINEEAITAAANCGKMMTEMAATIPNTGGLIAFFAGDNKISQFGGQLYLFGVYLKKYSESVADLNVEAVTASVSAAKGLVQVANALGNSGGIKSLWEGDNKLSTFGNQIASFGKKLSEYASNVSGIDAGAIGTSVSAAKKLVQLINSMANLNTSGVNGFVNAVNTLGTTSVNKFVSAFTGATGKLNSAGANLMNALTSGIQSRQGSVTSAANNVVSTITKAISAKNSTLIKMGANIVTSLVNGIKSKQPAFVNAVNALVNKLISGLNSQRNKIANAFKSALSAGASSARGMHQAYYSAGAYVAQGFANGISSNAYKARLASAAMASAAAQAARQALAVNSPSKVFYEIGGFAGAGLINALNDKSTSVYKTAYQMGESAKYGLSRAMNTIGDKLSGVADYTPTIKPVYDLNSIQAGELQLDAAVSTYFSKPVDSLSSVITNAQSEINASNTRVIEAINDLRDDINMLYNSDDKEVALYVDSNKLASSIASPMNRQLNIISRREGGL